MNANIFNSALTLFKISHFLSHIQTHLLGSRVKHIIEMIIKNLIFIIFNIFHYLSILNTLFIQANLILQQILHLFLFIFHHHLVFFLIRVKRNIMIILYLTHIIILITSIRCLVYHPLIVIHYYLFLFLFLNW